VLLPERTGWVSADAARSLRKIDLWILPAFCITQGLAYLDKTALNYGNLFGMRTGLNVTTAQFVGAPLHVFRISC
jgi:hypothetical protein